MSADRNAGAAPLASMELAIAYVLRYGVILCALVIAFGLATRLFHWLPVHERSLTVVTELRTATESPTMASLVPRDLTEIAGGLRALDPDAVMAVGLLLLIALPIVRVAMTIVLFLIERDYVYLAITFFVFGVLIAGLMFGRVT